MKKIISVLLSCVLLFGVCAPLSVFAAESSTGETVFLTQDFEGFAVGEEPKSGFDGSAITATARITVEEENGGKVAKYWVDGAERPSGPRLQKDVSARGLKEFTVEYDIKSSGGSSTFALALYGKESATQLGSNFAASDYKKWTHIKLDFDLENLSVQAYADGKAVQETSLSEFTDDTLTIWFGSSIALDGSFVMIDNIKIYTAQKGYDPNAGLTADDIKGTYNAKDAVAETGDIVTIIDEDFETQTAGKLVAMRANGGFGTSAIKETAPILVKEEGGNKFAHAFHGNPDTPDTIQGQRLGKTMTFVGVKNLVWDMDIKSSKNGKSTLAGYIVDNETAKTVVSISIPTTFSEWTHIKVRFDFVNKVANVYVGGKHYREYKADLGETVNGDFRIVGQLHGDGSDWMIDNFKLTTPDKDAGGIVSLSGEFRVDQVKIDARENLGMTDVMRMSHPRIYVHDWQQVRDKIDTDENYKIWYKRTVDAADNILRNPPVARVVNARNNINESSSTAKTYLITLAGAYGLTGDVRYKDRLYQELENVGNWEDWDGKTYLCTAHLIYGTALAYDWLYNDWTPEERKNIENWLIQKGMSQAVLGYEGQISGTSNWINSVSNWNNVCNGANVVAAIALADTRPALAEYVFAKANAALQASFVEVSADGAYAETVGYWDYGVRYQVKMMAALDSCLKEGASLPAELDYKDNTGLGNTGDFPIYYNGTTAAFNYGDGVDTLASTPILYWFATKYDKPRYAWYNLNLINSYDQVDHPKDHNAILSILWYDPVHTAGADTSAALDKFYQSYEPNGANGISMRSSWTDKNALVVMAHAGDASTGHINHDAGGFVLDWAGKRWVHMYGRTPAGQSGGVLYAWPGYFSINQASGGRFDYYHTRGEANNTIIANPQQDMSDMQPGYYAAVERFDSDANKAFGIIDMTDTNADYISAKRGFMLTDMRETLIIQDEIKASKESEYYWFANTLATVTLAADGKSAVLEMDGDLMLVRITQGPADAKLDVMPTSPLPTSPNPAIQKAIQEEKLFIHVKGAKELNLTVEFTPLKEGEGTPPMQPIVALDAWSVDGAPALTTSQTLGDIVALKVDNPNAYAKGAKTYVDANNIDIKPIVENGRTLVPVRFIAEKFGATVGWDDKTQTVSVDTTTQSIRLQLGSDQMLVNGNAVTLDVPAKEIGGRTLIPLRALVEALGKQVFWDDRGLIIISDAAVNYDAETINKIIDLLDIRVQIDGAELKFFDSEVYDYYVSAAAGATPTVTASAANGASVVQGNPAVVTVGDKNYNIHFVENVFSGVYGGEGALRKLVLTPDNGPKPSGQKHLQIQSATSSIEWTVDKYPMNGTYDGIINDDITFNRWSANGAGHWIAYDLGEVKTLHSVAIAGYLTAARSYTFEVAVSNDGENWTVVLPSAVTTSGTDRNVFKLGDVQARYVRITGLATTGTTWVGICETRIYGSAEAEAIDQASWSSEFYAGTIHGLVGDVRKVLISGMNGRGETVELNMAELKITSTDTSVATVDAEGNVKLIGAGEAKINVEAVIGGMVRTYSIAVRVQ